MTRKTFKDFVQQDVTNVFVNTDEMAEEAIIQGVKMDIIPDTFAILQGDKENQIASYDIVFHVASSYFAEVPQAEQIMDFNGKDYFIETVHDHMGMLTIGLTRNKS